MLVSSDLYDVTENDTDEEEIFITEEELQIHFWARPSALFCEIKKYSVFIV